jgi:hypothetical protein
MKKIVLISSIVTCSLAWGNSVNIDINDDTLKLGIQYFLNNSSILNDDSNYFLTVSYLDSEEDNSNKSTQRLITSDLKVVNPYINDNGFSLGLGISVVLADNYNSKSFTATPFGLYATYTFNNDISFDGSVQYAPKVLTFLDGESYKFTNLKANYRVINNGYVYIGVRDITTKYKDIGDIDYDDSLFFGYKVNF